MEFKKLIPWGQDKSLAPHTNDPFHTLQNRVARLFEDMEPMALRFPDVFGGPNEPKLDIDETAEEVRVTAELPGVDEKDVEVTLHDDHLTLSGEKRAERERDEDGRHYTERTFGSFSRTIPLPCEVDSDQAEARFAKGVLTVRMPKSEHAQQSGKKLVIEKA